jgi:hypothetical protein
MQKNYDNPFKKLQITLKSVTKKDYAYNDMRFFFLHFLL